MDAKSTNDNDSFQCVPHKKGVDASACAGVCSGACHGAGRMWVVAACGGHISIYEKMGKSGVMLVPQGQDITPSSLELLTLTLKDALVKKRFEQLLIVGSANDISWVQSLLPEEVFQCIVAEIRYPLEPEWFHETPRMLHLSNALSEILRA